MPQDGSNSDKQRIRAHAAETGRSYLDAARDLERGPAGSAPAGRDVWLNVRTPRGTGCHTVKADQIAAVRVRGPLSEASLRRRQPGESQHPYLLQIRVRDTDSDEWLTVACGSSEPFQNHAAQALLNALAERTSDRGKGRPVFGTVRDESDENLVTVDWR